MRVVLVEDSEIFRGHLKRLFRMQPQTFVVQEISNQQDAVQWFEANPNDWDLALVDLFLEKGNGFKVLHACRSRNPGQRVAVVSNYVTDFVRERVSEAGADAFFDKSNELDAMVDFCKASSNQLP